MGNAVWLFLALPQWFFSSILMPFGAGALTIIPALGVVCFGIAATLGVRLRAKKLWISAFLVYRLREVWLPAILLAAFSMSYASWAWFVAQMAFTDMWL